MKDTPDPLKDLEPTEPFAPAWFDGAIDFICEHPALVAVAIVAFAVGMSLL